MASRGSTGISASLIFSEDFGGCPIGLEHEEKFEDGKPLRDDHVRGLLQHECLHLLTNAWRLIA